MKKSWTLFVISSITLSMSALMAQDYTQLALEIAKAQETNREQLKNYSWQRSSKAYRSGEEKAHTLVKVWFNSQGEMESTVISSESNVRKQPGVRGKMQQSAGGDLMDLLEKSLNLSINYIYLSKGNWIDLMDRSAVNEGGDAINIDSKDVLVNGDATHFALNGSTKLLTSLKVSSLVDGKPFTSSISFKPMSDGTNRPVHIEIEIPSETLKVTAENINYIKQK